MSQAKQSNQVTRQVHILADTYRTLRHISIDRDARLIEVTEEAINFYLAHKGLLGSVETNRPSPN